MKQALPSVIAPDDHSDGHSGETASPPPDPSASPGVRALFCGFLALGFTSFGGALPLARRALVERRGWLSADEFTDLLGLCQFLPGGNVINLSVAVGMRFRGWRGALAGLLGLIAGPSLAVIGLGVLYERTQNDPHVRHLFVGLAAAAAGLLISMALKILLPLRHDPRAALVTALGFVAIGFLRTPLLPTMLVLTPLGIALAARAARSAGPPERASEGVSGGTSGGTPEGSSGGVPLTAKGRESLEGGTSGGTSGGASPGAPR